jgi:tripartite-type tricarboxylate transporter receptor subunit TctC
MAIITDRRALLCASGLAVAMPLFARTAWALDYPTRPVHIIVGFPAGIVPDIIARLVAQELPARLGNTFVVDNKPGAAANLAASVVAHSPPDGYTLLVVSSSYATNASLYTNLDYDLLRDIAFVSGGMRSANVLVTNLAVPAQTLPEFIGYAKANPGKLNYASTGTGSATHMAGALFADMTGIELVHVPYHTNYFSDLLAGQVQLTFTPIGAALQLVRDGKLRALGVTGASRSAVLPDVPAVKEVVPGYEAYIWNGFGAPAGTDPQIIEKLNKAINDALLKTSIAGKLAETGAEPVVMSPSEFGDFVADETAKWAKVIKAANIKPE